jgi:teichuronic acid biosynthesis glycosyltransferase TuaG
MAQGSREGLRFGAARHRCARANDVNAGVELPRVPEPIRAAPPAPGELVSVIIPCFNAAACIADTVDSVLGQTYRNLELIVVDDRSTDNSVQLVHARAGSDPRVTLIEMPRNTGAPAGPRNVGVRAARGAWVAFLDADDLWHPRKLEYQMRALLGGGALMCSTRMRDLQPGERPVFPEPTQACAVQRINLNMQLTKYRTPTSSIVIRRDLMAKLPFNEDLSFKAREDTDCFIRAHEYIEHSLKLIFPFVLYRVQDSQISGNKLRMVGRHLHMLKQYRFRSGADLGLKAYYYTLTHFAMSLYFRAFRRML